MLVGNNPEEAHPVIGMRLRAAVERGAKLIVVDPREIGLAKKADIHLKLRPGTNVAFANGMVNVLIQKGAWWTTSSWKAHQGLRDLGRDGARLRPSWWRISAASMRATWKPPPRCTQRPIAPPSSTAWAWWSTPRAPRALWRFQTWRWPRASWASPGCGINPLRQRNNVQGACDMGAGPADFTGYQKVANPEMRAKFEAA